MSELNNKNINISQLLYKLICSLVFDKKLNKENEISDNYNYMVNYMFYIFLNIYIVQTDPNYIKASLLKISSL